MKDKYTPGQDCGCYAYSESECGCDADWTPSEVYELRGKLERERALADRLADCLNNLWHHHSLTEASYDYIDNTLDAWKEARSEV